MLSTPTPRLVLKAYHFGHLILDCFCNGHQCCRPSQYALH